MQNSEGPLAAPFKLSSFEQFRAMLSSHRSLAASLSLFNAWIFAMSWSGVLDAPFGPLANGLAVNGFWLISLIVCTLVLAAFFLVSRLRRGPGRGGLIASACCMTASVVLIGVAGLSPEAAPVLPLVGAISSGVGTGMMTAFWGSLITRYDSGVVLHFVAFSLLASALTTALIALAPPPAALACMMAIPFAAAFSFYRALYQDGEGLQGASEETPYAPSDDPASVGASSSERERRVSPLAVFMGLVVVLGASAGLLRSLMGADALAAQSAGVFGIAAACAAAMLLLSKVPGDGESFALFYRAIGFIAAAFVVMALAVQQTPWRATFALAIHTMGFMYFFGLLWVFCVIYTRRCNDVARVFIGGFLASQAGQIFGAAAGNWFHAALDPQSIVASASNAMIYLLLFASIVLMARLSTESRPRQTMTNDGSMARACTLASARFALTPRESEILVYLVKGYDRGFIAQSLSVSTETVKSHTRHIYEKLDAHTRLELFNTVARCLEE